jgi:hypothetical protein
LHNLALNQIAMIVKRYISQITKLRYNFILNEFMIKTVVFDALKQATDEKMARDQNVLFLEKMSATMEDLTK